MAQSERRRQKKADAKKRRERDHGRKRADRDKQTLAIDGLRRKAPMLKHHLGQQGYRQNFYDYLDSYRDAFYREAGNAVQRSSSIVGVHVVDDREYYGNQDGGFAGRLGYPGLTQIFVTLSDVGNEYRAADRKSNINGITEAYRDETGALKTLVLIRNIVPDVELTECKFAFKLMALLHELGHVEDWEQGINLKEGDVAILDAEVYAHRHAMRRLMDGDYRSTLGCYLSAFRALPAAESYKRAVGERVVCLPEFAQCEEYAKDNWFNHLSIDSTMSHEMLEAMKALWLLARVL